MIRVKQVVILLTAIFCLQSAAPLSAKELTMGYFILSPHVIRSDNGKPVGAVVDWFNKYIAPKMSDTVKWNSEGLPVPRLLNKLKQGQVDMAILFAKNPARAKFLFYPNSSYLDVVSGLMVKKDSPLSKISGLGQIKDLKIGYGKGNFIPPPIQKANLKFELISRKDFHKVNIRKLVANRIDAVFDPQTIVLEYNAKLFGVTDKVKVLDLPGKLVGSYTVFSKKSTSPQIVSGYDKALKSAMAEMPYPKFLRQWKDPSN